MPELESLFLTIIKVSLLILIAGLVAEYAIRRRKIASETVQSQAKQQQLVELSKELKILKKALIRKSEIADLIPLMAKKLTERLPQDALPSIGVRCAKDLFHAKQVGFFAPVDDTSDYTMEVGVGFPPDWQGKIKLKSDEGILGMALQKKLVIARVDSLSSAGRRPSNQSFEGLNVFPDFVAPVFGVSGIMGVLVIAGMHLPLDEERKNVSMLADLVSIALRNATLIDSGITKTWADHLTGVSNRLHFMQRFEIEIRRAENYGQPISLFMFDIDEFKVINDTYGHSAGDQVIKKLAEIVRSNTRSSDLVGRYGGDEFMVLMTSSNREQAQTYADNLREKISGTQISVQGHLSPIRLTISGGLAVFPGNGISTTELFQAADAALYEAKRMGRNKMIMAKSVGLDGKVINGHAASDTKPAPPVIEIRDIQDEPSIFASKT